MSILSIVNQESPTRYQLVACLLSKACRMVDIENGSGLLFAANGPGASAQQPGQASEPRFNTFLGI